MSFDFSKMSAHHVGIYVSDIERSMKWYQEILGFTPMFRKVFNIPMPTGDSIDMAWCKSAKGDFYIEFYDAPFAKPVDMENYWWNLGTKHINFSIPREQFEEFSDWLFDNEVDVLVDGKHEEEACGKPGGCRVIYLLDPDGILIEVTEDYTPGEY